MKQIISQLERTAGKGNFDTVNEFEVDDFDEDEFEDEFEFDRELFKLPFEEQKQEFIRLSNVTQDSSPTADFKRMLDLSVLLFPSIVDEDLIDEYCEEIGQDLDIDILSDEVVSDEMLGAEPGELDDEVKELFFDVYGAINKDPLLAAKALKELRNRAGDIAAATYLEIAILHLHDSKKHIPGLIDAIRKFPDYPLIKLQWFTHVISTEVTQDILINYKPNLDSIFPNRKSIQEFEMLQYLLYYIHYLSIEQDATKLDVFDAYVGELDLSEDSLTIMATMLSMVKLRCLIDQLQA